MPKPPIPAWASIGSTACGAIQTPLAATDLVTLLNEADSETLDAVRNRLFYGGISEHVTQNDINQICANATDGEKNAFAQCMQMPSGYWFEGLSIIYSLAPVLVRDDFVKLVVDDVFQQDHLATELRLIETGESTFTATKLAAGEWLLVLTLTQELLKKVDIELVDVSIAECEQNRTMKVPSLIYKNPISNERTNQRDFFQGLYNLLSALLRCCPPCLETGWVVGAIIEQEGVLSLDTLTTAIKFDEVANPFPKVYQFGEPPIKLYGKFAWRFLDGTFDEVQFLNMDKQVIYVPEEKTVNGFMWHLNYGVELQWSTRQSIGFWSGAPFP